MTRNRGFTLRALVLGLVVAVPHFALAQQNATRAPSPAPSSASPAPSSSLSDAARRDSVVKLARAQLGRRYIFGGTTPSGFDCSGFMKYLMRAMGVELPRTAAQQAQVGREVPRDLSLLRPGDILTFSRGSRVTHVGMYVGNGRYIHASSGQGRIVESELSRPQSRLVRAWTGVRRMFAADTAARPNTTVAATTVAPQVVTP